jgi:hypothetical protein
MWIYNGKELVEIPKGYIGFTYLITNITNNKKYLGKKVFYFSKIKKIKGKQKHYKIVSDWQTYYGSSPALLADIEKLGKDKFKREIMYLCTDKTQLSYLELKEQVLRGALETEEYYNDFIFVRIHRTRSLKGISNCPIQLKIEEKAEENLAQKSEQLEQKPTEQSKAKEKA